MLSLVLVSLASLAFGLLLGYGYGLFHTASWATDYVRRMESKANLREIALHRRIYELNQKAMCQKGGDNDR